MPVGYIKDGYFPILTGQVLNSVSEPNADQRPITEMVETEEKNGAKPTQGSSPPGGEGVAAAPSVNTEEPNTTTTTTPSAVGNNNGNDDSNKTKTTTTTTTEDQMQVDDDGSNGEGTDKNVASDDSALNDQMAKLAKRCDDLLEVNQRLQEAQKRDAAALAAARKAEAESKEAEKKAKASAREAASRAINDRLAVVSKALGADFTQAVKCSTTNGDGDLVESQMDIDTATGITQALEKVSEQYKASKTSEEKLAKELDEMNRAIGMNAPVTSNKRRLEEIAEPTAAAGTTYNASAVDGDKKNTEGLPMHTQAFIEGKMSYGELFASCMKERNGSDFHGKVNASVGGGISSHSTAFARHCGSQGSASGQLADIRPDIASIGMRNMFPGIWDQFMSINNEFKNGVPRFVGAKISRDLNTYQHKMMIGESKLSIDDTMPPPPGTNNRVYRRDVDQ